MSQSWQKCFRGGWTDRQMERAEIIEPASRAWGSKYSEQSVEQLLRTVGYQD